MMLNDFLTYLLMSVPISSVFVRMDMGALGTLMSVFSGQSALTFRRRTSEWVLLHGGRKQCRVHDLRRLRSKLGEKESDKIS